MENRIVIGGLYRHYKGNVYRVLQIAKHTETMETLVVYADITDPQKIWARPVSMWNETVSAKDGDTLRFRLLEGE